MYNFSKSFFFATAIAASLAFTACSDDDDDAATPSATIEAVDLGLSVQWANVNVGADRPEGYGTLYGYGDPTGKVVSKDDADYPDTDISDTEFDIAKVNLGDDWRMPTRDEVIELTSKCTWQIDTVNGIAGYRVVGTTGNSIFLPAAGIRDGNDVNNQGSTGIYWSGTLRKSGVTEVILFSGAYHSPHESYGLHYGQSVRAVHK